MTKDEAINMMLYYQDQMDRINNKYGTGVRPSHVSTDLSICWNNIKEYKRIAMDLGWSETDGTS